MLIGVLKEIKDNEYRVGIVPSTVRELTEAAELHTQAWIACGEACQSPAPWRHV